MSDTLKHLKDFGRAARDAGTTMEKFFVAWARTFASAPHKPDDVNGDGTRAVCLRCQVDWPCAEWIRLNPDPEGQRHNA